MSRWTKKRQQKSKRQSKLADLRKRYELSRRYGDGLFKDYSLLATAMNMLEQELQQARRSIDQFTDMISVRTDDMNPHRSVVFRLGLEYAVDKHLFLMRAERRSMGRGDYGYMAATIARQVEQAVYDRLIEEFGKYFGGKASGA